MQSKRGDRDGTDTESGDDQAGSPLHVLSDVAHKEGHLQTQPEETAAAVAAAQRMALSRMQARQGGSVAALAASGMGELMPLQPQPRLLW